jgi:hypothetical protein
LNHIQESKDHSKKKSIKIRSLKKERDVLKIEILKLKQIYSDKCDGYRDVRHKLQRKLKRREDTIAKMEEKLVMLEQGANFDYSQ